MKFKRMLAIMLAGAMSISVIGCANQENETTQKTESAVKVDKEQESTASADNQIAEEPETFTIAMCENTNVIDWESNYMTLKLEEELGINLEFVMFPSNLTEAKTKLSLMANGGEELPDIILLANNNVFSHAEAMEYANAGIFIPLNDYFADSSITPNYNAIVEEYPEDAESIMSAITSPDGNIYSFFYYVPAEWNMTPYRIWMNTEWLEAVGKEIPTTTEELKDVLYAFATEDPNGNGIKDEIPFTGCTSGWGTNGIYALMNSFVFTNAKLNNNGLALGEDGTTVVAPFVSDEWRAGLEYMRELCEEGLLDPALFTMSADALKALLDQETNVVGCVTAASYSSMWAGGLENKNFAEFELIAPMEGPEGIAYAPKQAYAPNRLFTITSYCDNPEMAARIGDWFLSRENSISTRFGEEGVEWSTDESILSEYVGTYDAAGFDATVAVLSNIWGAPQNKMWYEISPKYENADFGKGIATDKVGGDTRTADITSQNYLLYSDAQPTLLPELSYTIEESEKISEIITNIVNYVEVQMSSFITGNISMDEWDDYLEEIDNMGLETWLDTAQTAYERMTK